MSLARNLLLAVVVQAPVVASVLVSMSAVAQYLRNEVSWTESSRLHRFDATHDVLFFRRGFFLQKSSPPLRSYNEDGTQRGADISLFKDFPDLEKASVDDFAAGPAGTTLIAAELIYGPRHVKNVILTYDSTGDLRAALNISSAEAIATDEQGDVYVLGQDNDPSPRNPKHPLLVEFDPSGRIIGSFLDESTFKTGSDAIEDSGPGHEMVSATVMMSDGKLYIYAPSEKQVVICSLDGKILRRAALDEVAAKIARADKVTRAPISDVGFVDDHQVVLYVTEYVEPDEPNVDNLPKVRTAAYLVDLTTKRFKLILRGKLDLTQAFVGVEGDQVLTLTRTQQGFEIQRHDLF
jgi:hypothetical protein